MAESAPLRQLLLKRPSGRPVTILVDESIYHRATVLKEFSDKDTLDKLFKAAIAVEKENIQPNAEAETIQSKEDHIQPNAEPETQSKEDHSDSQGSSINDSNVNWKREHVLLLVSLYTEHQGQFNNSSFKTTEVWRNIGTKMRERQYFYSGLQCQNKFKSLKHRYKTIKDSHGLTGRGRTRWEYFEVMDELLAGDPCVAPISILSSSKAQPLSDSQNNCPSTSISTHTQGNVFTTPTPPPQQSNSPNVTTPTTTQQQSHSTRTPTTSQTLSSATEGTPTVKRRRRQAEAPDWFKTFVDSHNRRLDAVIASGERLAAAAEQRNRTFDKYVETMINKK